MAGPAGASSLARSGPPDPPPGHAPYLALTSREHVRRNGWAAVECRPLTPTLSPDGGEGSY